MSLPDLVRKLAKEAAPALEQWIEAAEAIAEFREVATEHGIDWSELKAVLVAKIKDDRDGGDRLTKMLTKKDCALAYADALKLNMAENRKSPPQFKSAAQRAASSGEPVSNPSPPSLADTGSTIPGDQSSSPVAATARSVAGPSIPDDLSIPDFMRRNLINV